MGSRICLCLVSCLIYLANGELHLLALGKVGHGAKPISAPFEISTSGLPEPTIVSPIEAINLFPAGVMDCSTISTQNNKVTVSPQPSCLNVPIVVGEWPLSIYGALDTIGKKSGVFKWYLSEFLWPSPFPIDGHRSPLGVVGNYYNIKYGNPNEAKKYPDGSLAFVFSIEIQEKDNPEAKYFIDKIRDSVKYGRRSVNGESKSTVNWWTNHMNTSHHATFWGTAMEPPFNPVTYIVSLQKNMTAISQRQLNVMKSIQDENGNPVEHNARDLQAPPYFGSIINVKSSSPTTSLVPWSWLPDVTKVIDMISNLPSLG